MLRRIHESMNIHEGWRYARVCLIHDVHHDLHLAYPNFDFETFWVYNICCSCNCLSAQARMGSWESGQSQPTDVCGRWNCDGRLQAQMLTTITQQYPERVQAYQALVPCLAAPTKNEVFHGVSVSMFPFKTLKPRRPSNLLRHTINTL